ncbi:alcohol dehydrogenase [Coniosporium apollinis CBS 100218]|uniref:Alcohol dehydrogenase n=1 Tax=Coniosporium apollinis (strain CBS 100218) TaxID=1168221 RepID=R7YMY1_CONA1|nr:alcohol dehydrogenase [Coniosporium apollinis CBS 100218]EON63218.1 alcohol dehydrogenase [Coniosporium apollinis CBS 100218]
MPSFTVFKGSNDGSIHKSSTTRPDLKDDQVFLRVTSSGLCGTDLHYRHADMVLGHEGCGVVESVGPTVKHLRAGDRVGWGYQHDSCGRCDQCLKGMETYCAERAMYGYADLDQGSFASHAVWREAFLFKIPDGISDVDAAPLMCGGATVFGALAIYGVQPTDTVGVIGVGGLGHLAIQFAAKMGCDVVVFSGTNSKKEEAMKLGATHFYATRGAKEIKSEKKIDHLLVTTSAQPDWSLYFPVLAPNATIYPLSVADGDFKVPYMPLISNGLRIQGSVVAPRGIHKKMLEFAARHDIKPIVMRYPMTVEGIEEAMKTLDEGGMRYRGVLVSEQQS